MVHIIWCGNKEWDSRFPEKPLHENAVKIKRPVNKRIKTADHKYVYR